MNVNDTNNTRGKVERQWEMLEEADITDRDRETIRTFVRVHRKGNQGRDPNTIYSDLSTLRNASLRAEIPLVEMTQVDYRSLLNRLTTPKSQGGYGLDPSKTGIRGYKRVLRLLFEWLDEQPDFGDFSFYENIELQSQSVERIDEDQILTPEEIQDLKQAANNRRDATFIEFLPDSVARISLATQLRIKDIHDLDTDKPYFTPNTNGMGHKGAPDKRYPILQSRADLRTWINHVHPDPKPNAPLWPVLRDYDPDNPEECAVSSDRIRDILRGCARCAGVDKPVNPHNFRHTAITRLSRDGFTPQEIKHLAGWADERMLKKYDHTTDQQRNDQIRLRLGFIDEEEAEVEPSQPKSCGNCREQISPAARFCPRCGSPTTEKAQVAVDEQDDRVFESAAMADGELAEAVLELRDLFEEHPALRGATIDT